MSMLDHVTTGPVRRPRRALIYGVQGVGKSTFGAMAEAPIFIQTEDGLSDIDCSASSGVTPSTDIDAGTVTFDIDDASDIVDCTFTNYLKRGTIVVNPSW